MTSVWGVSVVAILDSSVNYVCVWLTKKLTMLACCVAANCNNLQTTPGITMHELPRNWPAVRRKWIKFIQFKRADFLAAPHHAYCVASTSLSAISQTPWNTTCRSWHDVPVLFQNPAWQAQTDTARGSLGQSVSFVFRAQVGHFAATPQSDVVDIWSRDLGVMATLSVQQKMPFFAHL